MKHHEITYLLNRQLTAARFTFKKMSLRQLITTA